MENHWFKFTLHESILRQMTKKEYKDAMSWLRLCRRKVEGKISYNQLNK